METGSLNIDWQQFHFLRPRALYLFIPLALAAALLILGNRESGRWKQIVTPALRPFLFLKGSRWAFILPLLFFLLGASFAIVGIAGPTWKKLQVPGQKVQAVVLVAMDLSASMLAKDIPPDRLERARMKLSDFLNAKPGAKTGLLAYAGTPHLVLPFTSDDKLIKLHAGSLRNNEMPVQGKNTALLIQAIDTLMAPILAPSHILLLTDEVTADDAAQFSAYTQRSVHRIEVLLMSSPNGGAVPGFKGVDSRQDPTVTAGLAGNDRIHIHALTLDTTDVGRIAAQVRQQLVFEKDQQKDNKEWDDKGALCILPALLMALLAFRRGWVVQWCCVACCFASGCNPDWWYTKDYQGQRAYNAKQYANAADRFTDLPHKGVAYFKAGDYEAAAAVFAMDSSAAGDYNRAVALSKLGRFDEAAMAFEAAEKKDTSLRKLADAGRKNMHVKKVETDSVMRYDKHNDSILQKAAHPKDSLHERQRTSADQKLASETQVKKLPQSGDRLTENVKSNIHTARESNEPPKPGDSGKAGTTDLKDVILRKPPADPGEFLHKRFVLQQKKYYKDVKPGPQLW
ncbi:vWA domain-containing protein [Chitinophaga lutea]